MRYKKLLSIFMLVTLTSCSVSSQKNSSISPASFQQLIGCWQGTLNYAGTIIRKPYTTTAQLIVKQLDNSGTFELLHIYIKDHDEQAADTLTISTDGKKLNNASIISRQSTGGNTEIITESQGFDHDNNTEATIRQTYFIGKEQYTYKKEIRLKGQAEWIERQQFIYTRIACNNKNGRSLQ